MWLVRAWITMPLMKNAQANARIGKSLLLKLCLEFIPEFIRIIVSRSHLGRRNCRCHHAADRYTTYGFKSAAISAHAVAGAMPLNHYPRKLRSSGNRVAFGPQICGQILLHLNGVFVRHGVQMLVKIWQ